MRQSLILLAVLFTAVLVYTAYGLMTFEPDPATPFAFAEPVVPPEYNADGTASASAAADPQRQQTDAAMAQLTQAITLYQSYERDASQQAASTLSILNTAIFNGRMPAYLLSPVKGTGRSFELITLDPTKTTAIRSGESVLSCGAGTNLFDILVGDNGDNQLTCDALAASTALDRVFLGGPGNDTINSAFGNRIVNAGTGDDTITVGPGRTIIILDDAWGKDALNVDCTGARVNPETEVPKDFPIPWVQPNMNFILLSPRINPNDVTWNGLTLTNRTTGDTLSVNENCFNLIGAGEASSQ